MKTKCLVVDDEPLARDVLRNYLLKLEEFEIVAECSNATAAIKALGNHAVDLMFVDVQMPQISGIDLLRMLHKSPEVIITTAYREYAYDGFELEVIDYLLKPFTFERFLRSITKYQQAMQNNRPQAALPSEKLPAENACIYLKENRKMLKVAAEEILYLKGLSEYVQIHTKRKKIVTKTTLTHMEEMLLPHQFIRIHKSYIVPLLKVEAFTARYIELAGLQLPIGRSYKKSVLTTLHAMR